ncbi:hypothetical protein sce7416 [Sorangium cellulosum So ce56]|uniref:Uncharacterized protein n=1 Tax=Sorangium cellulosum (strain So ce56) TaxID=448385 RepID=A9EYY3_SORC5|nr:hypothetical protein [Sorangium cellulosum]CAN97585.1 hypothetical protein sce7416 [Sorangium cellulosum So ce56]
MTDKHVPWGAPESERAAQPGRPLPPAHGSGIPFRPLPVPPLMAPGALRPLSAQYALSPHLQQQSPPAFSGPMPSAPAFSGPVASAPAFSGAMPAPAFSGPAPAGYTQPPTASVSARGGTLPPGIVSQQDVLSASGVFSPSALPFISAPPQSDPVPPSQAAFQPAPITDRMGASATQPPAPAAPPGFASPGPGAAAPAAPEAARAPMPSPHAGQPPAPAAPPGFGSPGFGAAAPAVSEAARTPMPSLHAGMPAQAGPPPAAAPAPAMSAAPGAGAAAHGAPQAAGGWDGAAESPWATTSARLEMPALPSTFVQERPEPQKPPAAVAPRRREGGRTLIIVLSVILAVALLALIGITLWQSMGGGGPIAIDYKEPPPTAAEASPEPTVSVTAAPSAPAAPRPAARPRPKSDDIYDEVEKEKTRR